MEKFEQNWERTSDLSGNRYICGYCGTDTSPSKGWFSTSISGYQGFVLICTYCNRPSFIETHNSEVIDITPSTKMGREVNGLPSDIQILYDEARNCTSVNCYTSAVLACRKILMHVAVEKGAEVGKSFFFYVNYLLEKHIIPPDGMDWVDHIRTKSNEANHEILIMSMNDADDLITFTEMLLRLVYEFKHRLKNTQEEMK